MLGLSVALAALDAPAAEIPDYRASHCYRWDWGGESDLAPDSAARIVQADRVGKAGIDGSTTWRELMPGVYQMGMVMPAFDFDSRNHGAVNHPFYLTVRFRDVAGEPVEVHAGKGGSGFYGAGWVGAFGGAADGLWKEETVIIPRSMMRSSDGRTFRFALTNVTAAVPVDWVELWSADAALPDVDERIAAATAAVAARRDAARRRLLPGFRDLGLPEAGPSPEPTAAEKDRGFRVFFPPVSRQLFANSAPLDGELSDSVSVYACRGETETILAAVRGLRAIAGVTVGVSLDGAPGIDCRPHSVGCLQRAANRLVMGQGLPRLP